MPTESFLPILLNAALLLALGAVYDVLMPVRQGRLISGLVVGLLAVLVMLTPWVYEPGVTLDSRSILMSITGLYLGLVPTLIGGAIAIAARAARGGPGVTLGVIAILLPSLVGICWRYVRRANVAQIGWQELLGIALTSNLLVLSSSAVFGPSPGLLRDYAPTALLIYPLGTLALGTLMRNRLRRQAAMEQLADSERRYRAMFEKAAVGAAEVDAKTGDHLRVNARYCQILGYSDQQIMSMSFAQLIHPEDHEVVEQMGLSMLAGHLREFSADARLVRRDGSLRWVHGVVAAMWAEGEEPTRMAVSVQDVTEQMEAHAAVRQAERFVRSTIDALASMLCVLDERGTILMANDAWNRFVKERAKTSGVLGVGGNYIELAENVKGADCAETARFAAGIRGVLSGKLQDYVQEHSFDGSWFVSRVTKFSDNGPLRLVVHHVDVTRRKLTEKALVESEARFRAVVEEFPEAIFIQVNGHFGYLNPAAARLFGVCEAKALVGKPILDCFAEERRESVSARMRQLNEERRSVEMARSQIRRPDGTPVDVEVSALPFRFEGHDAGLVFARDITLQRRAEREMARAAQFSMSLLKQAPVLIWRAGLDKLCDWFNETWLSFTGRTMEQEYGAGWVEGVHPDDVAGCLHTYESAFDEQKPFSMEYRLRRNDGAYRWILDEGIPYEDIDGRFAGYIGYCFDITERKQAEQALRDMATEVSYAEERERRRLAEELHDEVCQILSLAQIKLSMTRQIEDRSRELAGEAEGLVLRANRSLRSLLMQMSPPPLYDLGISAAVEWLIEDVYRLYEMKVCLDDDRSLSRMEVRMRVLLFQCLRELLANVAKHSGVRTALVKLYSKEGHAFLEVHDSGRGFVVEKLERHATDGGFGLFAIRERVRSLKGKLEIRSVPGQGAVVIVSVPLQYTTDELCANIAGG